MLRRLAIEIMYNCFENEGFRVVRIDNSAGPPESESARYELGRLLGNLQFCNVCS